jgi:hypothetical protein
MFFSYRTRQKLARVFPWLLTALVLLVVAAMCWLLWLQRFVVYTPQGAKFDFDYVPPTAEGVIPQKPANSHVQIEYPMEEPNLPQKPQDPDDPAGPILPEIPVLGDVVSGYVVELSAIQSDPEAVRKQVEPLPAGTAVLVRVVNFWGYRYYTSGYGTLISEENRLKLDGMIRWMAERDLYMIARVPAFRDYYYSTANLSCCLTKTNGYPYEDAVYCYWLNPRNDTVLTRLTQIAKELQNLGFDEVVFDDFTMPTAETISFTGDRKEAIYEAAETLAVACASDDFTVSFVTDDLDFRLPQANCRLYIENAEASQVESILEQLETLDDRRCVVFFCSNYDDRFNACGALRPIELAQ